MYYKFLVIIVLLLNYLQAIGQHIPGIAIGGAKNDMGLSICPAHGGGYAIAGSTRSFGAGSNDFYFLVIDTCGQIVIDNVYGWKHHDFFRDIIPIDNGYAFVGDAWDYGPGGLDIYLCTTDISGNKLNDKFLGTPKRDNAFSILQTNEKGYLLLGHSRLVNTMGDILLLKVDSDGNLIWQKSFAGEGNDYAFQIINSSRNDGYVFIGSKNGFFDDVHADFKTHDADFLFYKIDTAGNQIWKKTYGKSGHDFGYSVCNAPDGGYYLLGSSQSYGNGSFDMLLIKTDLNGNEEWVKSFGGSDFEYGKSIVINKDEDLYLVGSSKSFGTEGSVDLYIVKTDQNGNELWSETIGGNKNDYGEDVIALPNGGCAIAGKTNSIGNGKSDVFFVRLTSSGAVDIFTKTPECTEQKIMFYPNPMTNLGFIVIPDTSHNNYLIQILNSAGQVVANYNTNNRKIAIHRGNLSSGIYFYKIISKTTGIADYTGKLIIR